MNDQVSQKPRLAFVLDAFPALSETFILNQVTGLLDRDADLDLYAMIRRGPDQAHEDVHRYGLLDKTTYCPDMPQNKAARIGLGMVYWLKLFARQPSAALVTLSSKRHGRLATSLRLLYEVCPFFTPKRYDLVHCHFGHIGASIARMRQMNLMPGKLVVTFYGFDVSQRPKMEPAGYYDALFAQASRVLVLSQNMKENVAALGCPQDKITIHHLGVDSRKFPFKARSRQGDEPIRLLSISRLEEKKGLAYAIAALGQIKQQRDDFIYEIVGEGSLREPLQKQINELGLENHIKLLGWKTQDQVRAFLDKTHIMLAPSVTAKAGDQEGTPTAIAEALMMGLPVVSTLHSGIPEMIQHEVSGYLAPERDADALAQYLLKLFNEPESWATMGRAGSDYARREFDVNLLNDQLLEIYHQVLHPAEESR